MATQKAVSAHLDISAERFRQLQKRGVFPPSKGRGGYDQDACRVAYIRHLRGVASGQHDESGEKLAVSETRAELQVEQAKRVRLQNLEAEGRLIDIDEVREVFSEAVVLLASTLDGAAGRIAGGDSVQRAKLLNEHRRIRDVFADRLSAYADATEVGPSGPVAAIPGRVGVGRGKTKTTKGRR